MSKTTFEKESQTSADRCHKIKSCGLAVAKGRAGRGDLLDQSNSPCPKPPTSDASKKPPPGIEPRTFSLQDRRAHAAAAPVFDCLFRVWRVHVCVCACACVHAHGHACMQPSTPTCLPGSSVANRPSCAIGRPPQNPQAPPLSPPRAARTAHTPAHAHDSRCPA